MFEKIKKTFNRIFRGWHYTTLGEVFDKARTFKKPELVRRIVNFAGLLNGHEAVIEGSFEKELMSKSKRVLLRTFMVLQMAYTQKLKGFDTKIYLE